MVEALKSEKTTAEVIGTLDPERQRPLLRSLQAIGACGRDDLEALYSRHPQARETTALHSVLTAV